MKKTIVNWSVVNEEQITPVFMKMKFFEDTCLSCNYSIKKFHEYIIGVAVKDNVVKSDWDIKNFVFELLNIPFDYDNMSSEQLKFLRQISKRYFTIPLKFNLKNYITEQIQIKNN